jgi:AcrR family transcriptional regulator
LPDQDRSRADRGRQAQPERAQADQDRRPAQEPAQPERAQADQDRRPTPRERREQKWQAQRERQRANRDRGQAKREREAPGGPDTAAYEDALWPPFPGHGWPPDRGPRAHRVRPERGQPGRGRNRATPTLSRAEIVDAAIAIADAEGSDAISMRRIAQVLRAGTMSLYWHVVNKDQLLDLMQDALMAEITVPEASGDWRADVRQLARNIRGMLMRHRWVMDFIGGRPPLGPNTLLHLEGTLGMLDEPGLDLLTVMQILETVQTYVMGAVLRELRELRFQRDEEAAGITEEAWQPAQEAWRNQLAADGRFTRVVEFIDENIDPDAEETRDERFEFGLDCVIDGIAAKIAAKSAGAAP